MQTFLPFADFEQTAQVLDPSRLGNQCWREAKTLYGGGWPNHPAAKMWWGHDWYLCDYGAALAREVSRRADLGVRGHRREIGDKWQRYWLEERDRHDRYAPPAWLGCHELHASHRAALLFKDPDWYAPLFPGDKAATPNDRGSLPYVWPVT